MNLKFMKQWKLQREVIIRSAVVNTNAVVESAVSANAGGQEQEVNPISILKSTA